MLTTRSIKELPHSSTKYGTFLWNLWSFIRKPLTLELRPNQHSDLKLEESTRTHRDHRPTGVAGVEAEGHSFVLLLYQTCAVRVIQV